MNAEKVTKTRRRGSAVAVSQTANVDNDVLPYLSSVPAQTALQGIIDDRSRWKQTADGGYSYGDLARTFVAMGDPRSQPTVDQQAATFNKILELDDSAARMFLYVMARDLARPADAPKSRLHVNEQLEFKGYKRHAKGDFFPQTKRDEQRRLVQLSDIRGSKRETGPAIISGAVTLQSLDLTLSVDEIYEDGLMMRTLRRPRLPFHN